MVLRIIALLFFSFAVALGFSLGWGYQLGEALFRVNAAGLNSFQAGVQRYLAPAIWDGVFVPLLSMPAWALPVAIGVMFLMIAALRPGRG